MPRPDRLPFSSTRQPTDHASPLSGSRAAPARTTNRLLNALPQGEYARLSPYLEPVILRAGTVLHHPERHGTQVYFPGRRTAAVVSVCGEGGSAGVGLVGDEGLVGGGGFLGGGPSLLASVRMPGEAWRVRADVLQKEFTRGGPLQHLLLRYAEGFLAQVAQTAACNTAHRIDARLAKWLLMCWDRSQSRRLEMTHDGIATMLGVRRAGVTEAAGRLRSAGLIEYHRQGHIAVVNRAGLEEASCECYPILQKELARLP